MRETDRGTFDSAFRRVCGAFRLRLTPAERDELATTYFRVLSDYPLDEVLVAGKTCIAKCRTFPRAADWLSALADRAVATAAPPQMRTLTVEEADERWRAEHAGYRAAPCACAACVAASVTDREVRYVPTDGDDRGRGDGYERVWNARKGAMDIAGHWAHGDELRRWYVARDAFFALRGRFARRLAPLVSAFSTRARG